MERKIVSLGRSSLVVSLPKHWVKLNGLKQGDVVSLGVQRDRSLVVFPRPEKGREPMEMTLRIEPNEKENLIARKIIGCYLNGYSSVKIESNNIFSVTQRKTIRNIVNMLYMRIMESDARSMFIQTLIDESKASLELAINRMHSISQSMCRDALNALQNQDAMLAKTVSSLDDDVDHFCFFIMRLLRHAAQDSVLANQLGLEPLDCMEHQRLVQRIEYAADHAANIANHVVMLNGSKQRIPADLLKLMFAAGTDATDLYEKAVVAFFEKDVVSSNEIVEQLDNIEKMDREIASRAFMSKQKNPEMICAICSLRDGILRIAEFAVDIAEVAINRAFRIPV